MPGRRVGVQVGRAEHADGAARVGFAGRCVAVVKGGKAAPTLLCSV